MAFDTDELHWPHTGNTTHAPSQKACCGVQQALRFALYGI
jgi:hypothetical protein